MAAGRTLRSLVSRRRRAADDGEDEDGPMLVEDSQSEGSVLTERDDEEVEGSIAGDASAPEAAVEESARSNVEVAGSGAKSKKARKSNKKTSKQSKASSTEPVQSPINFRAAADTEAMMNGLKIDEKSNSQQEAVDFESSGLSGTLVAPVAVNGDGSTPVDRHRKEHEEYRRKRDSDPAFIPNRGNFFMHDTRGQANGQGPAPQRTVWSGRGRGRGGPSVGGPFSPMHHTAQMERTAEQPWKHDLHEVINEDRLPQQRSIPVAAGRPDLGQTNATSRLMPPPHQTQAQPPTRSFSSTVVTGKARIQVALPGMKAPITLPEIPWKHYIRLPDHRPPLRRDKPVRVSLPDRPPQYIFPKTERSFIFIPRQMRPNQQGYTRGGYQRSINGYGYSSRRTSMYGGSIYSGSVAPSRRSSLAGMSRERAFSPAASIAGMSNRPVVRLPHGSQHPSAYSTPMGPLSGQQTPTGMLHVHTFPPPQQPSKFGTPATSVHQPRPQKAISVSGIESPMLQQGPNEPQPFQNQLPAHINEQGAYSQQLPPPYFSPAQQYAYGPPQRQVGTPLSGIPEQAIHAQSFQPPPYGQSPYYAPYPPQQGFYYGPPGSNGYPPMPMYMPPPPQGYGMPQQHPLPPQEHTSQPSEESHQQRPQSGMVAHESNGMVFYVPAAEAQQSEQQYQPAESFVPTYAMPGLPPPTPAPDSQMPYYYPPAGLPEMGHAMYYQGQPQQ